jgi:replication factor A1
MLNSTAVANVDDIREGAIMRLDEFIVNLLAGQMVVILVNYTLMGQGTADTKSFAAAVPAAAPVSNPYANPYAPTANTPAANIRPISNDYNSAPVSNVVPISALNPYTNRWTIKARITAKTDVRTWSNPKGEGSLFSIDLLDNEGTAIRSTFFKAAVDRWYEVLEEGRVYYFTGGKLKPANAKFSNIKNNYEITFDERSEIKECFEGSDIKAQSYDFVSVLSINNKEPGDTIDLLAIVKSASDVSEIVSQKQNGKVICKRELTVTDDSGGEIRITLWGEKATNPPPYPYEEHPIIAFKGVRIGDFGGRSLSCTGSTSIAFNPNLPEAVQLHTWRQQFQDGILPTGQNLSGQGRDGGGSQDSMERRKTINMIKDDNMGFGEKPDFVSLKGSISFIKHDNDPWYCACPTEGCHKKVFETVDNKWTCEKCNANFENCNRRYVMSVTMSDHSGQAWFSMFNDTVSCTTWCVYLCTCVENEL